MLCCVLLQNIFIVCIMHCCLMIKTSMKMIPMTIMITDDEYDDDGRDVNDW